MKKNLKKYWYVLLILVSFIPLYFILLDDEEKIIEEENIILEEKEVVIDNSNICYVDIKGEVKTVGVYEIDCDKRIIDVIELAGGLTKNADVSLLNLSKKVKDEMSIKIYSKSDIENAKKLLDNEVVEKIVEVEKIIEKECDCQNNDACIDNDFTDTTPSIKDNKININTASKEELMSITGIGESKAIKIMEYRKNSKFETIEDIKNVDGFGESTFEKIKEFITV